MQVSITKSIFGYIFLFSLSGAVAQQKEGKITIEIKKDINGKTETFKKVYNSEEEMDADKDLRSFTGDDDEFNFVFSGSENKIIRLDQAEGDHTYAFSFDSDAEKVIREIKAIKPSVNDSALREIEVHINKLGHDLARINIDEDFNPSEFNKKSIRKEKMVIIGDEDNIEWVGKEEVSSGRRKLSIEKVENNEFGKMGRVKDQEFLSLIDLSYYPNPSKARFKLEFTPKEEGPVSIKVFNIKGQEVYVRYLPHFKGLFSEIIDMEGQDEGVYLLEISSDKKRLTRKILIQ